MDDLAQDCLVGLVRNIHRYDPARPFGPWLRTLVRNHCRSAHRKDAGRATVALESDPESPAPDPSRALDLSDGARSALEAFALLTPRQREVMVLCTQDGMTPTEAADQLEVSGATVRSLLHQARAAIRVRLLEHRPELLDLVRSR